MYGRYLENRRELVPARLCAARTASDPRWPSLVKAKLVAGALMLVFALVACSNASPHATYETPSKVPHSTLSPPYDHPPGGGAVRVVEQGVSPASDGGGGHLVSYGVVLENTSKYGALRTQLTIRILDSSGRPMMTNSEPAIQRTAYLIPPGRGTAIGGIAYTNGGAPASLSVKIGATEWWPPHNEYFEFAELLTKNVVMERDGYSATLTFTVVSHYSKTLEHPVSYAIFRNHSGKVVGGAGPRRFTSYAPGSSEGEMDIERGVPHGIEDGLTEVYISPSCC